MKYLLNSLTLLAFAIGISFSALAADNPNLLVMGEDADKDTVPRDSRVFKRVLGALDNQMHEQNFNVFDETTITLDNFSQGRIRRTDAEIIDVARSVKRPPIDIAVIFAIYASAKDKGYTTKVNTRIEGRLLNVKTGQKLGNFEVAARNYNAPANCNRECILKVVGDKSRILGNDLGAVLAEKLAWMVDGGAQLTGQNRAGTNNMMTNYNLVFSGFTDREFSDMEEYLVIFSGYHSHRPTVASKTHTEVWYSSSIGTAKLNRNLKRMLAALNLSGYPSFDQNTQTFTVKKISLRGKTHKAQNDGSW